MCKAHIIPCDLVTVTVDDARFQRHIPECDSLRSSQAKIRISLTNIFLTCTNIPNSLVFTGSDKCQALASSNSILAIQRVRSLAKRDCITVFCFFYCLSKALRRYYIILRQCHDRQHADQHDQRQQTG